MQLLHLNAHYPGDLIVTYASSMLVMNRQFKPAFLACRSTRDVWASSVSACWRLSEPTRALCSRCVGCSLTSGFCQEVWPPRLQGSHFRQCRQNATCQFLNKLLMGLLVFLSLPLQLIKTMSISVLRLSCCQRCVNG